MASDRDINDLSRFYDTSEDNRTQTQIMWEEGIYKEGSLRQKWAYSFGRNGFYKFGKKISACLCLMLLWTVISIVLPLGRLNILPHTIAVALVNTASVWLYRQTCEEKSFTALNKIYILLCIVFTLVFYRYMDFVFGRISESIALSLYYGVFEISPFISRAVMICVCAAALFCIFVRNFTRGERLFCAISALSVINGAVFMLAGRGESFYKASLALTLVTTVLGFCLYIKTRNKTLSNISLVFSLLSFMEIMGRYAVITGVMESYIEKGIF